jgi:sodium-dependent phosphate cotransporter
VGLLEAGIAALGKGFQEGLLESVSNPISGLCAGLLATVLVQSSSVSTSTIVGLVGAGTLPLALAVPMVMGANIGTTVTSTLAALGSIRRADEFQRAFAAATVHDFFNLLAVAVLLPLEIATGLLQRMAAGLTEVVLGAGVSGGEPGKSPIRAAVKLPVQWVEGLLEPGRVAAVVLLVVGLAVIFMALGLITRNMRRLVAGSVERVMNRVVGKGGGLAGVLTLASAYPITLGANVGTTITALLASLAVVRPEGLTIALVHLLFNVVGILVLYPLPMLRMVPIRLAEGLAEAAVRRTRVVFAYTVTVFLVLPLLGVFLIQ